MTLILSSKSDEPKHPQAREIKRNCGQILGRLDELLPCLYIAQYSASKRAMRKRTTDTAGGLFAVGEHIDGNHPHIVQRLGLILPLNMCRDERMRAALLEIPALLDSAASTTMSDRRRMVQARLDQAFGGGLRIADKESLDGFFALTPEPRLFQRLSESFDYVTEVLDNTAGAARVTRTSRFHWRSYGELMEWYHGLQDVGPFGQWPTLIPFFICGNTGGAHSYSIEHWARSRLSRPTEEPSKWFVIRPGLPDATLGIRLEMGEFGWARLYLTFNEVSIKIYLSQVFDPFPTLVTWGREIDEGDLPIEMEIDEEGQEAVLTVLRTENPERVLLRVRRKDEDVDKNEILLEGIVARATLAATLKAELIRFFTTDFDPQHWDLRYDNNLENDNDLENGDDPENECIQIRDFILNHPWLASGP